MMQCFVILDHPEVMDDKLVDHDCILVIHRIPNVSKELNI